MKTKLGALNCLYPLPTVLAGANVGGKPNFITMAHVGIMDLGSVSMGMSKGHHTNAGIKANKTFSINIPSVALVKETDYCGLVSGRDADKAKLFDVFYGALRTAPMIRQCPICMECRLIQIVDFPKHDVFVGEVVETWADEAVLTAGKVDLAKVQPFLFDMPSGGYWKLGERFAGAWQAGKELKEKP
ncbi:MAG: flavin reductase family protein [Candidatus Brocadiia bacterium]|jgi:flavin reductase (DIM6/NTAB) family NADH-FMN oxidoreductase RutF